MTDINLKSTGMDNNSALAEIHHLSCLRKLAISERIVQDFKVNGCLHMKKIIEENTNMLIRGYSEKDRREVLKYALKKCSILAERADMKIKEENAND